jgi:hypothetical protein
MISPRRAYDDTVRIDVDRLHDMLDEPDVAPHPVEPKVRAATAAGASSAAVLVPFVLWLLGTYLFRGDVPLPVQGFVGLVITGGCTFVAGYYARHVDRAPSTG